jgi:hypothetical protein
MSLYRQVPEGWKPAATYRDLLAKRAPKDETITETHSERVNRVASTFVPNEVRLMTGDEVIGRQIDLDDGLHRVVDAPEYLYDRHSEDFGGDK